MIGVNSRHRIWFTALILFAIIAVAVMAYMIYKYQLPKIPSKGVFV